MEFLPLVNLLDYKMIGLKIFAFAFLFVTVAFVAPLMRSLLVCSMANFELSANPHKFGGRTDERFIRSLVSLMGVPFDFYSVALTSLTGFTVVSDASALLSITLKAFFVIYK